MGWENPQLSDLTSAIEKFAESSSMAAEEMIKLTNKIRYLTWFIAGLALVQFSQTPLGLRLQSYLFKLID